MKFGRVNVYRASFDLVVNDAWDGDRVEVNADPVEERLIVGTDLEDALESAKAMRNDLRYGAVHKETVVRDLVLVQADVMIRTEG